MARRVRYTDAHTVLGEGLVLSVDEPASSFAVGGEIVDQEGKAWIVRKVEGFVTLTVPPLAYSALTVIAKGIER